MHFTIHFVFEVKYSYSKNLIVTHPYSSCAVCACVVCQAVNMQQFSFSLNLSKAFLIDDMIYIHTQYLYGSMTMLRTETCLCKLLVWCL